MFILGVEMMSLSYQLEILWYQVCTLSVLFVRVFGRTAVFVGRHNVCARSDGRITFEWR